MNDEKLQFIVLPLKIFYYAANLILSMTQILVPVIQQLQKKAIQNQFRMIIKGITYTSLPTAKIIEKFSGKKAYWKELVIFYGRIELLVTGFVYISNGSLSAHLGASINLPPTTITSNTTQESKILVTEKAAPITLLKMIF